MPQVPYSLDLAPADFFLFSKLKTLVKGKHFAATGEIKKIETGTVGDTKKRISEVFRGLEKRWHKCIISEGSATVFTRLGQRLLFPLPKTKDTRERKAFC